MPVLTTRTVDDLRPNPCRPSTAKRHRGTGVPGLGDLGRAAVARLATGAVAGVLVGWLLVALAGGGWPVASLVVCGLLGLGAAAVLGPSTLTARLASGRTRPRSQRRLVVVGAGPDGDGIVASLVADPSPELVPVAVLDDDPGSPGRQLGGLAVTGTTADLAAVAARTRADAVVLANPSADSIAIQSLSAQARTVGLELLVVPAPSEAAGRAGTLDSAGNQWHSRLRPPTVEDLFARDPVAVDPLLPAAAITGRRVLLFGAAGSIGAPLAHQILELQPVAFVLVDQDENALRDLHNSLADHVRADVHFALGDVRDRERVFELFGRHQPEVVFHAAAVNSSQPPPCDPIEAIKTNAVGTKNLLDAAVHGSAMTFVHLSSAAAADPTTVIGATKLSAERLTALAAAETGRRYISVRTARIFDGRGSAVRAFRRQLDAGGPVTLSHRNATHLFLAASEAARLVLAATAIGEPGELLVIDAGYPVGLAQLAEHLMASAGGGAWVDVAGVEPPGALHDVLFRSNEIGITRVHPRIAHAAVELCDPCPALAEATGVSEGDIRAMISAGSRLRLVKGNRGSVG